MFSTKPTPGGKRWPRGQKFTLSPAGTEDEAAYRAAVLAARASGRAALESALAGWASPRSVQPADGVLLSELAGKRLGLGELTRALEAAGVAPDEVRAGIRRLVDAGIVVPVPLASQMRS